MGIRTKLLLPLLMLLMVIIGTVELYWLPSLTAREEIKQMKNQYDQLGVLEISLVDPLLDSDLGQLHLILDEVLNTHTEWRRFSLHNALGRRLYPLAESPRIAEAEHIFHVEHSIKHMGSTLGVIYLTIDLTQSFEDFQYDLRALDWLLLFLLPMVVFVSALLQDRFVRRPLHTLADAATRIAHGDFDVKLPKPNTDEVGRLVLAFDGMCKMRNIAETSLEKLAYFDMLTQLPNRVMFKEHLTKALKEAEKNDHKLSVMFIDLDRFKVVNDTLGHEIGDRLLIEAGERIVECIRAGDLVARLGGDEFTVVVSEKRHHKGSRIIAERIIEALQQPFVFDGLKPVVSPSIGISLYPEHATSYGAMMQYADTAMYQSKSEGGNCYSYYTSEMGNKLAYNLNIEAGLRRALIKEEFVLHYQPKIHLATGKIVGMEALIRWNDPQKGMIPPNDFIPLAEETGLIIPIGEWVLHNACKQFAEWGMTDIELAINLSANHLYDAGLLDTLKTTLEKTNFAANQLEIEITENALMNDVGQTITILEQIRELGVKIAIDDFGTGYSSLSYLKRFAIDTIKIDRSFVSDIPHDADDVAITTATVALAHSLNRRVVAEGIETQEQADFLKKLGCEMGQGYYYSKPLTSKRNTQNVK